MGLCSIEYAWLLLWYPSSASYSFQHWNCFNSKPLIEICKTSSSNDWDRLAWMFVFCLFMHEKPHSHAAVLALTVIIILSKMIIPEGCCLFIVERNPMPRRCHLFFFCNKMTVVVISCFLWKTWATPSSQIF